MIVPLLIAAALAQSGSRPGRTDDVDEVIVPIDPFAHGVGAAAAPLAPSTALKLKEVIPPGSAGPDAPFSEQELRVRILDIVEVDGVRSNQLQGLGLVTGLNATGDKGNAARQALSNFVKNNQINVDLADVDIGNVALVTVTCQLEPWLKTGRQVDVSVQSVNGASSLFGGTLMPVPLLGHDGEVYVVAQGSVTVGGFSANGKAASVVQNHLTAGRVSGGGIVEREVPMSLLAPDGAMHLHLRTPSYVTATRVAAEIGSAFHLAARALDAATIRVVLTPERREDAVGFMAELEGREVTPGQEAVVVVNERTGTVVAGASVRVSTVAVTHGNLTITVAESQEISQPLPFSDGETAAVDRTDVTATEEQRPLQMIPGGTSVAQLAHSLNVVGVSPRDLVAIFQALARAGALHARLEIL